MKRTTRGISLIESMVVLALMGVLMIFLAEALRQSQKSFHYTNSSSDASRQLRKVTNDLEVDLQQTSSATIQRTSAPASLGAPDGDAIWFLSNRDATGTPVFHSNGEPFWQYNILYYLVVPNQHDATFGRSCAGGAGPDGNDDRCPHKLLIRKRIDTGDAASNNEDFDEEAPLTPAAVAAYLTRPQGYQTGFMNSEAGVTQVRVVGQQLLGFRATLHSTLLNLDLRAVTISRAQREVAMGSVSLYDSPYTFHFSQMVPLQTP